MLTEQEADQFAEELAENLNRDRRDGGPEADVARAYNEHWMDARRLEAVKDRRTSLIVDPPNGRIPPLVPLTPERIKARDAAQRRALPSSQARRPIRKKQRRRFVASFEPTYRRALPIIYNNDFQIFQSPGFVAIAPEMIHSARIIPLDGRPHIGKNLRQWLGDTRGHFEGNTLVVETTNFRPDPGGVYQNANPETFKITERFTRVDADRINYEFTVSDPTTWTAPWSAMIPWNKADGQLFEYACHEGNYDMVHLMAGGRKREKAGQVIAAPVRPGAGAEDR